MSYPTIQAALAENPGKTILHNADGTYSAIEPVTVDAYAVATVTPRQARLALLGAGKLAAVEAALAAMTGPQGEAARITWGFATEINRSDPLIEALAPVLNLTPAEIDALFVAASAL